jgi:uncharacterized protein
MLLDLTRIHGPREHFERTYPGSALTVDANDFRVVSDIRLVFDIEKNDDRYRLAGHAAATLELPCSRCLEWDQLPVDIAFDLTYLPQAANAGEGELEVAEDDLETAFYEHQQIDLAQLLREQFYLAIPMKPLCTPECRGLCPACGINRNLATCECQPTWQDPRLAPLKGLVAPDAHEPGTGGH